MFFRNKRSRSWSLADDSRARLIERLRETVAWWQHHAQAGIESWRHPGLQPTGWDSIQNSDWPPTEALIQAVDSTAEQRSASIRKHEIPRPPLATCLQAGSLLGNEVDRCTYFTLLADASPIFDSLDLPGWDLWADQISTTESAVDSRVIISWIPSHHVAELDEALAASVEGCVNWIDPEALGLLAS